MPCKPLQCVYGQHVIPQRYIVALMAFLAVINAYNLRITLHIAITEIAAPLTPSKRAAPLVCEDVDHDPIKVSGGTYNWTEKQQGVILMAFFPGYLITHIPGGVLADTVGGRYVVTAVILASAAITALTPVVIEQLSWLWLVGLRFILGLAQGPLFPAAANLMSHWIPLRQRSTLGGLVFSGIFLGSVTGNLISGYLMGIFHNWPVAFYFWSVVAVVWCIIFLLVCYSSPSSHPFITPEEKEMLEKEIGPVKKFKTPWKSILTDSALWSLIILQFGHDWLTYTLIVDLPKFFKEALKFNIEKNGLLTGISFGLMWIFSIIFGWISDCLIHRKTLTVLQARKVYTVISALGPGICSLMATYMGCNRVLVITWLWSGMVLMGPWFPGPKVNALDISLHFSGIIMALTNSSGQVAGMLTPYLCAIITKDGTLEEWQTVFWISVIMISVTMVVFLIWGSAERAKWDFVADDET